MEPSHTPASRGQAQARLRVAKKLLPGQPGTVKLARRHGDALVCVRYRVDTANRERYTTVELIVDRAPIGARTDCIVAVRVRYEEEALQRQIKQHGARWDPKAKLWRMPQSVASRLGLRGRIVESD
jgi:hypothetical protein